MQEERCFLEGTKLSMKIASVRVNKAKTRKNNLEFVTYF